MGGYGMIGLGAMGAPFAANLARAGLPVAGFDAAGSQARAPEGVTPLASVAELAAKCETAFLSLPDGAVCRAVAQEIAEAPGRILRAVIDLSTIGPSAAEEIAADLSAAGIAYADAPVSGGRAGAVAGTITVIWAGDEAMLDVHRPALDAIAGNVFHVGTQPGQGQAMKLLNNFLSATAMTATTEAIRFGLAAGLDMRVMCDVLNVSTGRNSATADKFPNRIATGTYDAGFATALMAKDMRLYHAAAEEAGTPNRVGTLIDALWQAADRAMPDSDFTRIYDYLESVRGHG